MKRIFISSVKKKFASVPRNPLLAESLYLTKYIERMGTGTGDMIAKCLEAGLPEPEFRIDGGCFVFTVKRNSGNNMTNVGLPPEVTPEVKRLLFALVGEMTRKELQEKLGLKDEKHFRESYQQPAVTAGLIEMTIPDKPKSRKQKYRLTEKGKRMAEI